MTKAPVLFQYISEGAHRSCGDLGATQPIAVLNLFRRILCVYIVQVTEMLRVNVSLPPIP